MAKKIVIDATYTEDTRVALINEKNIIESIEYETENKQQIKGNIYLAKIVRIEPSLQAAFIEYKNGKNGFLPFSEIHPDYYHIPTEDRKDNENVVAFKAITPPEITSEDLEEQRPISTSAMTTEDEVAVNFLDVTDQDIFSDNEVITETSDQELREREYKIQDVMKKGQVILVQAQKEERGNKGAAFTSYISLAGKYCVLMPNKFGNNGISRRIASLEERRRLRNIISDLTGDDKSSASVIVRTAGVGKTTYEIKRDYDYLARLWNRIREATMKSVAPAFIHMEEGIIIKTMRDMFDGSVSEILLQGPDAYKAAAEFMQNIVPSDAHKLKEYKGKVPIFTKFGIESQISALYQPIAHLPSGGYIVINPTEALISIDVNSGKATSERNVEETALKTNLEAATEIARQLRLRDLSGLIVVDFIDMYESKNRKLVERTFRQSLGRDRARIQTGQLSTFGLLEMSRQRIKSSFLEANSKICHHCNGKGVVRADASNAMLILRTVENEVFKHHVDVVNVFAHIDSVLYIMNNKRKEVVDIERKYNLKLNFMPDINSTSDSFSIEKIRSNQENHESKDSAKNIDEEAILSGVQKYASGFESDEEEIPAADPELHSVKPQGKEQDSNKRSKRKKRNKKPAANNTNQADVTSNVEGVSIEPPAIVVEEAKEAEVSIATEGSVESNEQKTSRTRKKIAAKRGKKKPSAEPTNE